MERREVEALNASLREFLFPCFNCFSIERTSNWKILLESSSPPPFVFYSSIGKIPPEYFMVKIPSNFFSIFFHVLSYVVFHILFCWKKYTSLYIFGKRSFSRITFSSCFVFSLLSVSVCLCIVSPSSYNLDDTCDLTRKGLFAIETVRACALGFFRGR